MNEPKLTNLYQQIILDHNRHPHNCGILKDADLQQRGVNPSCGDDYTLYIKKRGDIIEKISFQGTGCALSKASASILTNILENKDIAKSRKKSIEFVSWINSESQKAPSEEDLMIFEGVKNFPARAKCATLIHHSFLEATKKIK